ncbi:MAG: hypothetical protein GTO14_07020 [Anaerolineales bacterium]|nr:hypothetical protein [Anaerolineales bacterium]
MAPLTLALRAVRELGPGPLVLYALYRVQLRSGWLRWRTRQYSWEARPLSWWLQPGIPSDPDRYLEHRAQLARRFFTSFGVDFRASLTRLIGEADTKVIEEAREILDGRFRLFGARPVSLGFPPDWHSFAPMAGGENAESVGHDRHWTVYDENSLPADVKLLWEPARFGGVYPLVRAYHVTGEAQYAKAIWTMLESWRHFNHPNLGPHWFSAQEVALRLMAIVFAMFATLPWIEQDPERLCLYAQTIAVHAARIPPTLIYARAQGNNHLLVEAVALFTAGLLFPEFRQAERWHRLGRRWLETAVVEQIFPDGGYVQHSTNYQRLALQAGLWAARLAEVNEVPLSSDVLDALCRITRCLMALTDHESGRTANFGPNDGAHILPLSTCSGEDFRPTIQAASLALFGRRTIPPGPWDEACAWLGLEEETVVISRAEAERESTNGEPNDGFTLAPTLSLEGRGETRSVSQDVFPEAGLYFLRGEYSWGMLRCAQFRSRPGHSDQMHLDLWWHGQNAACDPGTYLYNGEAPWDNPLMAAGVHNTLLVDGLEPMKRVGRFLWLDWAQGGFLGSWRSQEGDLEVLAAEQRGYLRQGILHRRTVARVGDDFWLVADDLQGDGVHVATNGWLIPDRPWQWEQKQLTLKLWESQAEVRLDGPQGHVGLYRAGERIAGKEVAGQAHLWGWRSRTYAVKEPALRLVHHVEAPLPFRLQTWWTFDDFNPESISLDWNEPGSGSTALARIVWREQSLDVNDAHRVDTPGIRNIR